jgi:hypothetical protein
MQLVTSAWSITRVGNINLAGLIKFLGLILLSRAGFKYTFKWRFHSRVAFHAQLAVELKLIISFIIHSSIHSTELTLLSKCSFLLRSWRQRKANIWSNHRGTIYESNYHRSRHFANAQHHKICYCQGIRTRFQQPCQLLNSNSTEKATQCEVRSLDAN